MVYGVVLLICLLCGYCLLFNICSFDCDLILYDGCVFNCAVVYLNNYMLFGVSVGG